MLVLCTCISDSFVKRTLLTIVKFWNECFHTNKVYTNEGGIKQLYHSVSACAGDNPLAKARALFLRTGEQTMISLLL